MAAQGWVLLVESPKLYHCTTAPLQRIGTIMLARPRERLMAPLTGRRVLSVRADDTGDDGRQQGRDDTREHGSNQVGGVHVDDRLCNR